MFNVSERSWPQVILLLRSQNTLIGWRSSGATQFERWLEAERESLIALQRQALAGHAVMLEHQGEYRQALNAHLELLNHDDLQEHHHLAVMRLQAMLGERGAALEQFERLTRLLTRLLRREVGLEPLPETVALAEHIRAGEVPVSRLATVTTKLGSPGAPPLVERERAWWF